MGLGPPYLTQGWAGLKAEQKINPECRQRNEAAGDFVQLNDVAMAAAEPELDPEQKTLRAKNLRETAEIDAFKPVEVHWPAIKKVAKLLERHGKLSGDEVRTIVAATPPRDWRSAAIR
jgi:hypothetical protein